MNLSVHSYWHFTRDQSSPRALLTVSTTVLTSPTTAVQIATKWTLQPLIWIYCTFCDDSDYCTVVVTVKNEKLWIRRDA